MAQFAYEPQNDKAANLPAETDPGRVCLPDPVVVEPSPGAIDKYAHLLESNAVAVFFSVMSSTKASPSERLAAATAALKAVGKENPAANVQSQAPGLTLNLIAPVQSAFRGIADIVDVLDRTPRVNDGV